MSLFEEIQFEKRSKSVAIILANLSKKFYDNQNYYASKEGFIGLVVRPITSPYSLHVF